MDNKIIIPSKKSIRRAGEILKNPDSQAEEFKLAMNTLSQWRQVHSYPINTFQAYFRTRIKDKYPKSIIAQRLKRTPSIIDKLRRFPNMNLERMQDICGFRIILKDIADVYTLHKHFSQSKKFKHELILPPKDYIKEPKEDGYRSLHQVFKYNNRKHPELNDLRIELQIRTQLQHSWATSVETLGIIEKSSFKTGEGSLEFKRFFQLSSQLFALHEQPYTIDNTKDYTSFFKELDELEVRLKISQKLSGLAISAKHIETVSKDSSGYHLMELNLQNNKISLLPFTVNQLETAENMYRLVEEQNKDNPDYSVVLISAGNLAQIKKAYPNYFLDTKDFISKLEKIKLQLSNKL